MALNVGELVAELKIDSKQYDAAMEEAKASMESLATETESVTSGTDSVQQSLVSVGDAATGTVPQISSFADAIGELVAGNITTEELFAQIGGAVQAFGAALLDFAGTPVGGGVIALAALGGAIYVLIEQWNMATEAIDKYEARLAGLDSRAIRPAEDKAGRDRQIRRKEYEDSQLNDQEANAAKRYQDYKDQIGLDPTPGMRERLGEYGKLVIEIQNKRDRLYHEIRMLKNAPFPEEDKENAPRIPKSPKAKEASVTIERLGETPESIARRKAYQDMLDAQKDYATAVDAQNKQITDSWVSALSKQYDAIRNAAASMASAMRQETSDIVSILKDRQQKTAEQEKSRYEKMRELGAAGWAQMQSSLMGGNLPGETGPLNPTAYDILSAAGESRGKKQQESNLNNLVSGTMYGNALPAYDQIANAPQFEALNRTGVEQLTELRSMVYNTQLMLQAIQTGNRAPART